MSSRDQYASFAARFLPPLSAEAWRIIPWFVVGSLILFWIWTPLGWVGTALTIWCVTLLRKPARMAPKRTIVAISPVDGVVSAVATRAPPAELELGPDERVCVTITLGPWDSHVARAPAAGKIVRVAHGYGGREGERLSFAIDGDGGTVGAVLMAVGLGRRVRSDASDGQVLVPGGHLGILLFAGHGEIYLPPGIVTDIAVGQRMVAGETIIA